MNYNKAGAHLRMLGYQKVASGTRDEVWESPGKNPYFFRYDKQSWDMAPHYIERPMYKTLNMLNDPCK